MDNSLFLNIFSFLTSFTAAVIVLQIIFRTNDEIDRGFRYILIAPSVAALTSLFYIDKALVISGVVYPDAIFFGSRIITTTVFAFGAYKLLQAFSKNNCSDCKQ